MRNRHRLERTAGLVVLLCWLGCGDSGGPGSPDTRPPLAPDTAVVASACDPSDPSEEAQHECIINPAGPIQGGGTLVARQDPPANACM